MKLLFICTHNRCRSILAEAVTNHYADGKIQAFSAGSTPQVEVHPMSIKHLQQRGIKTDGLKSQSWDEFAELKPDAIITLCDSAAKESCPVWFGDTVQVHWGLHDPSKQTTDLAQQAQQFEDTIDLLANRVQALASIDHQSAQDEQLKVVLDSIANRFPQ